MKEKRSQKRRARSEGGAGSDERRGAGLETGGHKLTCRRGRVRSDGERKMENRMQNPGQRKWGEWGG